MEKMLIIQLFHKFKMHFCAFSCFVTSISPFFFCNGDECIFKHYQDHPEAASEVTTWHWLQANVYVHLLKPYIKIKISAITALILKCHFTAKNNNLSPKLERLCTEYSPDSANFQNSFKWTFFQILIFICNSCVWNYVHGWQCHKRHNNKSKDNS